MRNFEYHEPETLGEACLLLKGYGAAARVFAGGTHLTVLMKQGLVRPGALINLKKIPGLKGIVWHPGKGLTIGTLVTHHELETSSLVQRVWPFLSRVAREVGNIRVRTMGTVGGNLASGEPLTDLPCALLSLGSVVSVMGPSGGRSIALEDFFVDYYETVLAEDEILTEVVVPPLPPRTGFEYIRFTAGSVMDRPSVGVSARLSLEPQGLACREVRVSLGCVSSTPMRARDAERALEGQDWGPDALEDAAASAARECSPLDDLRGSARYKREMVRVLVRDALSMAHERANTGGKEP